MAAKIPPKQASLLKCPGCLGDMTEPRALQCAHLFCQRCIDDMKPKEGESTPSIECPVCDQITTKDKIQTMECIQELLEVVDSAKTDQIRCDKCKVQSPIWRCDHCKENFCAACYDNHNGFSFMKHHKWEKLTGDIQAVLDKHVYCKHPDHTGELVKLHCKDCNQLICMLCNGTEHKAHEAETISKALDTVVVSVKEKRIKMEQIIKEDEKVLQDTTVQGEEVKKKYEDLEKEIDRKYDEIIRKAGEDRNHVKQGLKHEKDKEFSKIETFRKQLEGRIQSQKNIAALSDSTLTTAQGTSLLQILQSGVGNSMDAYIEGGTKARRPLELADIKYEEELVPKSNLIGKISIQPQQKWETSDCINGSLLAMSKMKATLITEIELVEQCLKFMKVGDELWFLEYCTNNIDVYSLDGNKLRTVQYDQVGCIQSVEKLRAGLLLAAENGLYIADLNGGIKHEVMDGDICDVSLKGDMLCVLDNGAAKVHLLNLHEDGKSHTKQGDFTLQNYSKNQYNTIQITKDNIYIALYGSHKIFQYSYDGTIKAEFTSCRASIGQKLYHPKLCGVDAEGALLVVRYSGSHHAVVLTADGQWHSLPVTGLTWPHGACVEDDKLWVYDWRQHSCKQYVFK